jgi:hypothetical protein
VSLPTNSQFKRPTPISFNVRSQTLLSMCKPEVWVELCHIQSAILINSRYSG